MKVWLLHTLVSPALLLLLTTPTFAELRVPHIFGDHMVVQRDKPVEIWGWAEPDAKVVVAFGNRKSTEHHTPNADKNGAWQVRFPARAASSDPHQLLVASGGDTVRYHNILIGDVWVLGGQSNMEDVLESVYHGDTEVASANFPEIRLLTVPQEAGPKAFADMERLNEYNSWTRRHEQKGSWTNATPASVARFSAIGYVFGRRLHMVSQIPIGLVDASWGGTTAEAWTTRGSLEAIEDAAGLLAEWDEKVAAYDAEASLRQKIANWERDSERRKARGEKPNPKPTEPALDPQFDRNNPGAAFNGMIAPYTRFNIKGAIFNQGYNNALGNARPRLYGTVFEQMIRDWRAAFRDGELPFGIVGFTAGGQPQTLANFEERQMDAAPFIREAQVKAWQALDHVGYAPAYDQQVPWYHPHKKFELGERIARWAMHTQYGQGRIGWEPVRLDSFETKGDHIVLKFNNRVRVHDGRPFSGFAIAGEDRHFVPAEATFLVTGKDDRNRDKVDESQLVVRSSLVEKPVAVRYAWARNPLGNCVNSQHHERIIPVPTFRTDTWDWPEAPFKNDPDSEAERRHREAINKQRAQARDWAKQRPQKEAELLLRQLTQPARK